VGDRIEKVAIIIALILFVSADGWYCRQAMLGVIAPTLATWVVFEVGSVLSLASYHKYNQGKHPLISNVANHIDPVVVAVVASFVALSPKVDSRFRPWDYACLALAGVAVVVWRTTHSEIKANVIAQSVMGMGYAPMLLRMIREQRNTESFLMWSVSLVVAGLLLIPPVRHKNRLGILYIGRAIVCVTATLGLMGYFQFFGPR